MMERDSFGVLRVAVWAAALLALVSVLFLYWLTQARRSNAVLAPPTVEGGASLGTVPAFEMTDQTGNLFSSDALKGKVWVAEFFFTRCTGVCPVMNRNMAKVVEALQNWEDFAAVSFTVDPKNDTPQVLAEYAKQFGADATKWHFLAGRKEEVVRLSREGFLLGTSEVAEEFVHSNRFVLVGRDGKIEGHYVGTDEAEVHQLISDALRLLRAEG
ncbi:MAG: SCO family protein [Armatimonadota bacterium]